MHFRSVCLSGGGVTGVVHVGMLQRLEDENLLGGLDTIVATSAGAIVSILYAIGMSPTDIFNALATLDWSKALRFTGLDTFLTEMGLDDGAYFMAHMIDVLMARGVDPRVTFANFFKTYKKRLIITGTNTSAHEPVYFSPESTPDMRVLDAVRISMGIPFLFTAVRKGDDVYVDGGVSDNYPIQYCLQDFSHRFPLFPSVLGVIGSFVDSLPPRKTLDIKAHIFNVFASSIKKGKETDHTVAVYLTNLSSVDFDASPKLLKDAYEQGYNATGKHLDSLRAKACLHIKRRRSV